MMRVWVFVYLLLVVPAGCEPFGPSKLLDSVKDLPRPQSQNSKFEDLVFRAGEKYAHVVAEIERLLDQISPCPSKPEAGNGWCKFVSVSFTPKPGSAKSTGQRILVIDGGARMAAYTRYKSRVLDDIAPDDLGI